MCIYSPMPHTLSYCALIGKCALIRSNTVGHFDITKAARICYANQHGLAICTSNKDIKINHKEVFVIHAV